MTRLAWLLLAVAFVVAMSVATLLYIGHGPADWAQLKIGMNRDQTHLVLERYRADGRFDDSVDLDVLVVSRGWRDLWSINLIGVEYDSSRNPPLVTAIWSGRRSAYERLLRWARKRR